MYSRKENIKAEIRKNPKKSYKILFKGHKKKYFGVMYRS
jgi:hypothetical protein